jgi:hypothetical protein
VIAIKSHIGGSDTGKRTCSSEADKMLYYQRNLPVPSVFLGVKSQLSPPREHHGIGPRTIVRWDTEASTFNAYKPSEHI